MTRRTEYSNTPEEVVFEDGLIPSLYYLYREAMLAHAYDAAEVLEAAFDKTCAIIEQSGMLSQTCSDAMKAFQILRGFKALGAERREQFVREMDMMRRLNMINGGKERASH